MPDHWMTRMLVVVVALALSPVVFAQTSTRAEATRNPPDISGVWMQPPATFSLRLSPEDAPLQPWALKVYQENRQGVTRPTQSGLNGLDPEFYCLSNGVPRVFTTPAPFQIIQLPDQIVMIFQSQMNPLARRIYTDGRGHPDGFPTTFMGHSIGHWDGETLVVDTISLDADKWMDGLGTPHSEELHVVERIRRAARDTLEITFQFEDPKAFSRPWTGKKVFQLTPDYEFIPGILCEDRFKADFARKSLRDKTDWIEFRK